MKIPVWSWATNKLSSRSQIIFPLLQKLLHKILFLQVPICRYPYKAQAAYSLGVFLLLQVNRKYHHNSNLSKRENFSGLQKIWRTQIGLLSQIAVSLQFRSLIAKFFLRSRRTGSPVWWVKVKTQIDKTVRWAKVKSHLHLQPSYWINLYQTEIANNRAKWVFLSNKLKIGIANKRVKWVSSQFQIETSNRAK